MPADPREQATLDERQKNKQESAPPAQQNISGSAASCCQANAVDHSFGAAPRKWRHIDQKMGGPAIESLPTIAIIRSAAVCAAPFRRTAAVGERAADGRTGGMMFATRALAAAIAVVAAVGASPGAAQAGETAITCTNPASGATWQISIDYDRATVDSNPARISDAKISWHDAKDGGNYTLDRKSGDLTVDRRLEHRRLFPLRSLQAGELTPRSGDRPSARRPASWERRRWLSASPAPKVSIGFVSETGPRQRNEDFAGAVLGCRAAGAARRRGRGDRRRHRRRQGRSRRGRDRGARLSRRILRPARDHGGAARRRPGSSMRSTAGSIPRVGRTPTWRAWAAPSPRWCCAAASRICCMSATRAPTGSAATA